MAPKLAFRFAIVTLVVALLPAGAMGSVVSCTSDPGPYEPVSPYYTDYEAQANMREVPTTCEIDGGVDGTSVVGIFSNDLDLVSGTGYRDSFLRIDNNGNSNNMSHGYNTDARPIEGGYDTTPGGTKGDPNFSRAVQLGELGRFEIDGVEYFKFLLDINEPAATTDPDQPKWALSLAELSFYVADSQYLDNHTNGGVGGDTLGTQHDPDYATKVWDMDLGVDHGLWGDNYPSTGDAGTTIELDYNNYSGSGREDLVAYIPTSVFDAAGGDESWLYLYSNFGLPFNEDAGFEEWAFVSGTAPGGVVPEPGTLLLLGTGLLGAGGMARRRSGKDKA